MASCAKCGTQLFGTFCGTCGARNDVEGEPLGPLPSGGHPSKSTVVVSPASPARGAPGSAPHVVESQPAPPSTPMARPEGLTDLVHELADEVDAGAIVAPGEDDFFVGRLDEAVAFVLVGAPRTVPERCRGTFLARGPRMTEFDVEVGTFADAEAREARVSLRGSLALQVLDPIGFLDGDAPKTNGELVHLVIDNVAAALRGTLTDSLEGGSLDVPELVEGMKHEVLSAMLGTIVSRLDLPSTYGVSSWFDDVTLEAEAIAHEAPSAPQTRAEPPPSAPESVPFAVGAQVLVGWPDGNRYPASLQKIEQGQAYVVFPDGQQGWVPLERLSRA